MALDRLASTIRYYAAEHPNVTHFRWEEETTPGASLKFVSSAVGIYFASIFILKLLVSFRRSPVPLGFLQILHNLVLLVGSAGIFTGCLTATLVELQQSRWLWKSSGSLANSWLFCFPVETRPFGRIFFWSYVYYLSKIYELLDTLIVVLRKRRLTLFHWLQHAGNLLVCFAWLHFAQSLQVIFLLVNTFIQTLLYSYFFFASLGFDPPVKKLVTLLQIAQFLVSLAAAGWLAHLIQSGEKCSGTQACAANAGFNLVLMLLLINYYIQIYVRKKPTGNRPRKINKKQN